MESASRDEESTPLELFERDGFLVLRDIVPQTLLKEWQRFHVQHWKAIFETLHENGHTSFPSHCRVADDGTRQYALDKGIKNCFREIVMRSPGRYELSLLHPFAQQHPSLDPLIEILSKFIPQLLHVDSWNDLQISNLSLIVSAPGSLEQSWHADGGHVSISEHLPCHCLNIFLPLVNVTLENGPTEFRPGTHHHTRNLVPMMLSAKARKTLRPPVAPLLIIGDALVFDYRVLHRGKANQCSRVDEDRRTLLCITAALPWFKDILNYPKRSIEEVALK